jgi:hypothetical protein
VHAVIKTIHSSNHLTMIADIYKKIRHIATQGFTMVHPPWGYAHKDLLFISSSSSK